MRRRLAGPVPSLGRAALIAQAVAAMTFVALLLRAEGVRLPLTGSGDWTLRAAFADAGGIQSGERTPVLVAGVPEGAVTGVSVQHGQAIVSMRLSGAARGVIRRDASARIEPRSALEDMTVDITPGSGSVPAPDGMRIPAGATESTVTLDRVTSMLDSDTRTQVAILLDQLARGIGGRGGQLARAIEELRGELDPATRVAGALARRRVLLAQLVRSVSRVAQAAASRDGAIAASLSAGASTLGAVASEETAVTRSIGELPTTMTAVRGALGSVTSLAKPLVPALTRFEPVAATLPGALRAVRGATAPVQRLLSAANGLAGSQGVGAAAQVFGTLAPTATALQPVIARVQPIVSAVNAQRDGVAQLGERFSGVLSTDDANGPVLRGLGTFEPFNPADFGYPSAAGAKRTALAAQAAEGLTLLCLRGQPVACLIRYLVPGLPGAVR